MNILETIKAEIELLKKEGDIALQDAVETNDIESGFVCGGIISTCEKLLTKLDTLQEQHVKTDIVEDLKHYLATTPKEQIEKDWESLKEWGKVGPSISKFLGWEQPVCEGLEDEYEQIKQKVCSECPSHKDDGCGYVTRQLQRKCNYLSDVMYGYELGRQSKAFYAEELDEEIIRYKVPFLNEKENLDERTLNAIAYHFATWMESKLLHECESAYNNGYVAGQQSKEQPVSEGVEEAAKAYADYINANECLYTYTDFTDAFKAGAKWQREQNELSCEGLEEEINNYTSKHFFGSQTQGFFSSRTHGDIDCVDIVLVARHFAQWGAGHSGSSEIPKDLEEAAHSYSESDEPLYSPGHRFHWDSDSLFGKQIETTFIAGAKWQMEKDLSSINKSYESGVVFGMNAQKEQMMKDAVEGRITQDSDTKLIVVSEPIEGFKFGDNGRVVFVKEEEK